uniref:TCTP domain-containing protein n=1 Tax=Steinernema glaseri TaxID=37863 RepID=A0A1I8ACL6_9BILA
MAFDLNSPLNLYEKLQTCFDKSFLHSKYITSDVVEGLIFKLSPSKGEFCEIDEEEEYFEHGSTYKFVYYNSGAPPTAYIVYEASCLNSRSLV